MITAINIALTVIVWAAAIGILALVIFALWKVFTVIYDDLDGQVNWRKYWRHKYEAKLQKYLDKNNIQDSNKLE